MSVEKVLNVREVKEQPIPSRYERTESSGQWIMKDDKSIAWQETKKTMKFDTVLRDWVETETETIEQSPQESPFKLQKEMIADVILVREKDDDESPTGKTILTYLRKMKITVRPEHVNVWLTKENGFVFVKNLLKMFTYRQELATDELVTVSKLSEKRISKEDAIQLDTGYVFSKFEKIDGETELFGRFVKPQ